MEGEGAFGGDDVEMLAEGFRAEPELFEGEVALAVARVETHEAAVGFFVSGKGGEQALHDIEDFPIAGGFEIGAEGAE